MSVKTLIIATAALAASTAMTVPSFAAGGDGTGPNGTGPGQNANPPAATQPMPRATIMFSLLDTNKDGAVDKDEFAVLTTATFDSLDVNHDGKLTPDELRGRLGPMLGQRDGRRGPGMGQQGRNWQDRDDRGGSGRMDDRRGPMGRMGFNDRGGRGAGPLGPRLSFNDIDTNHDGVISADEFAAHQPAPGQGRGYGPRR